MANYVQLTSLVYVGAHADTKPSATQPKAWCIESDTGDKYYTTDGGATWTLLETGLANIDFGVTAEADFAAACVSALNTTLGAVDLAEAAGAVTATDKLMAYVKQLVTQALASAKELEYVEDHLHHKTVWYGKKSDQTTNWCDINSLTAYRATSGDNAWGTEGTDPAQCFSAADTLSELGTGLTKGDFDLFLFTANSSASVYKLRIVWGTGTLAAAIAAGQFSETMFNRDTADKSRFPRVWASPKIGINNKVWVICWNATNDATIDFFVGVHAYDF